MRKLIATMSVLLMLGVSALGGVAKAGSSPDPFASNNGIDVPNGVNPPPFSGPYEFRKLSHDYPATPPCAFLARRPPERADHPGQRRRLHDEAQGLCGAHAAENDRGASRLGPRLQRLV